MFPMKYFEALGVIPTLFLGLMFLKFSHVARLTTPHLLLSTPTVQHANYHVKFATVGLGLLFPI